MARLVVLVHDLLAHHAPADAQLVGSCSCRRLRGLRLRRPRQLLLGRHGALGAVRPSATATTESNKRHPLDRRRRRRRHPGRGRRGGGHPFGCAVGLDTRAALRREGHHDVLDEHLDPATTVKCGRHSATVTLSLGRPVQSTPRSVAPSRPGPPRPVPAPSLCKAFTARKAARGPPLSHTSRQTGRQADRNILRMACQAGPRINM